MSHSLLVPCSLALDRFLAGRWVGRTDSRYFEASPRATFRAFRELTLGEVPWLRNLLYLRALPRRFLHAGRQVRLAKGRGLLDGFLDHGFVVLEEKEDREILIGGIGRFWRLIDHLPLTHLDCPDDFVCFEEPGFVKAAFDISVLEQDDGSLLVSEIRMAATDEVAERAFLRYWRWISPMSGALRRSALRAVGRRLAREAALGSPIGGDNRLLVHR